MEVIIEVCTNKNITTFYDCPKRECGHKHKQPNKDIFIFLNLLHLFFLIFYFIYMIFFLSFKGFCLFFIMDFSNNFNYSNSNIFKIKIFNSVCDAAREVNGNHSNIVACMNGRQKSSYGYWWRYAEDEEIENID